MPLFSNCLLAVDRLAAAHHCKSFRNVIWPSQDVLIERVKSNLHSVINASQHLELLKPGSRRCSHHDSAILSHSGQDSWPKQDGCGESDG